MAETKTSRNIDNVPNIRTAEDVEILVLTCPSYAHLLDDFFKRFDKYYGKRTKELRVWRGAGVWSDELIKALDAVDDEYLIVLHEDFYFVNHTNIKALDRIIRYMHTHSEVGRINCSYGIHAPERVTRHEDIYWKYKDDAEYICSFCASIWRKSFMLRYLVEGEDPWRGEVNMSNRVKNTGETVLWSEIPVFFYEDAMRGGEFVEVPAYVETKLPNIEI